MYVIYERQNINTFRYTLYILGDLIYIYSSRYDTHILRHIICIYIHMNSGRYAIYIYILGDMIHIHILGDIRYVYILVDMLYIYILVDVVYIDRKRTRLG